MNNLTAKRNHLMVLAGGTGGHIYPALAVANALRGKGSELSWLGTSRGLEASVVPVNQIELRYIPVSGLRGHGIVSWLKAPFKLFWATVKSAQHIRQLNPDCILAMGGFVAGPGGLAAWLLRKPLIVHEQNAVAGLTNKYLAKLATRVLTGFRSVGGLPERAVWVGNPVRSEIVRSEKKTNRVVTNILVIGGSQGARSLNIHLASVFAKQKSSIDVWHQCGRSNAEQVKQSYQNVEFPIRVSEFIDNMAGAYAWADLLICRAGAMTIAECCAAAKPALLIPFPHSAGDHQVRNAEAMVDAGAALMLSNAQLSENVMVQKLHGLLTNHQRLKKMSEAAFSLHKPDALNSVVCVCEEYMNA